MTAILLPEGRQSFEDSAGNPLIGGKLYTYDAGTSTPRQTWADANQVAPNANPIILDARGEATVFWAGAYKVQLRDSLDNLIWTVDNVNSPLASITSSLIPSDDNTYDLGSVTKAWRQLYLGANHVPVLNDGNVGYTKRTPAEIAAGATPTNFFYPPGHWWRYGADPTGVLDSRIAIQASLNVANLGGVGDSYGPRGAYTCSGNLTVYPNTIVRGDGRNTTLVTFTHAGDGFVSTSNINSSTAIRINYRDFGVTCSSGVSTGGGIVDIAGSYVDLNNVKFSGFKFGTILDQSEHVHITHCEYITAAIAGAAGVWLVNGADHTVGALPFFTNRITIDSNQFNSAIANNYGILDDGGVNHSITDNNFNNPQFGVRIAGVFGLRLECNESEGCSAADLWMDETTIAGAFVGPCTGFTMSANTWQSLGVSHNLRLASARNGEIKANVFAQAAGSCISFFGGATNPTSGVTIGNNEKLSYGAGRTAAPWFSAATTAILRANNIQQAPMTYVVLAVGAPGAATVTPASMEYIHVGSRMYCRNTDGTNGEFVIVTAITSTTFTTVFASTKSANWTAYGATGADEEEGTWVPVMAGTGTAGVNTYSANTVGTYQRRGNWVHVKGTIDVTAIPTPMTGNLKITGLPFVAENVSNQFAVCNFAGFTGFTFAGGPWNCIGGLLTPGTSEISLTKSGTAVARVNMPVGDIPGATYTMYFEASYYTSTP